MQFARDCFTQWTKDRAIGDKPGELIDKDFQQQRESLIGMAKQGRPVPDSIRVMAADKCWSCQASLSSSHEHCDNCGVPARLPLVRILRYWVFTSHQIKAHCDAGRLPLSQAHACMNHAKSQIATLRSRLEKERVTMAEVVADAPGGTAGSSSSVGL